jgi:hypothetical protein
MTRKRFGSKKSTRRSSSTKRRRSTKKSRTRRRRSRSFGRRRKRSSKRRRSKRSKRSKRSRRFGSGPSLYQDQVNDLTGGMGPKNTAYWKNTGSTTGNPWNLGAAPLYFTSDGKYETSFEQNAAPQSISFEALPESYGVLGSWNPSSFGRRRRHRRSKSNKKKSLKNKKSGCGGCGVPVVMGYGKKKKIIRNKFGGPVEDLERMMSNMHLDVNEIDGLLNKIQKMKISKKISKQKIKKLDDIEWDLKMKRLDELEKADERGDVLLYTGDEPIVGQEPDYFNRYGIWEQSDKDGGEYEDGGEYGDEDDKEW